MSIRGTRVFPPAGIRGKQGNQGEQGSSSYSITPVALENTLLGTDPYVLDVVEDLPATGTIRFWGSITVTCGSQNRLAVTPLIAGSSLTTFTATQDYLGSSEMNTIAISGTSAVTAGDALSLSFNFSAGTGTLNTGCIFYVIE